MSPTTPQLVVALGATAGRALAGPKFRVTRDRGELLAWPGLLGDADTWADVRLLATVHPSAVLRADDRDAMYDGLVADLRVAAAALK